VRVAIKPSDPDFPYEIDALQLQLNIPKAYPKTPCTVQVLNSDIPKGFAM
jgi:ubiquitin-protein ligase